jgi:hypothetical protein
LLKWLGGLIVVGIVGVFLYEKFAPEKTKLSDEYNIPESQVYVDSKPHGCDFDDAPLGNKHCHYEKVVDVQRSCDAPSCPVTSVYVSWRKVED